MFRISKIQFFESNSQQASLSVRMECRCSEYQRYNFLKAIHNHRTLSVNPACVVQNIKDTIFWKQFTTRDHRQMLKKSCSEYQRYNFLKAIHNPVFIFNLSYLVVQNIKDTIFWKQFTTYKPFHLHVIKLFRISKIQFFESNSQEALKGAKKHRPG